MNRIGFGWDRHNLAPDIPLKIGGVPIPSPVGPVAHSDGDALLHALIDAVLGATASGDIGTLFPPSDPTYAGADSSELLRTALSVAGNPRFQNVDCTVVLDAPRLSEHIDSIRSSLSGLLDLPVENISVKPKTFEGDSSKIEAYAAVLLA